MGGTHDLPNFKALWPTGWTTDFKSVRTMGRIMVVRGPMIAHIVNGADCVSVDLFLFLILNMVLLLFQGSLNFIHHLP